MKHPLTFSIGMVCLLSATVSNGSPLSSEKSRCALVPGFSRVVEKELSTKEQQQVGYGMAVFNKSTGQLLCQDYWAEDRIVYPASSIKTLVAMAVLRKIDRGELHLTDILTITQPNADAECRGWGCELYGIGGRVSVSRLLNDMITISNNIATNQLIETVSKDFINETADLMGADSLRVYRRLYQSVNPDPEITKRNTASAGGMVQMYREVSTGARGVLSKENRRYMIALLGRQKYHNRLNFYFPSDVKFYHKTGSTSISSSDAGFYYSGDAVVVLVGLQDFRDYGPLQKVGKQALSLLGSAVDRLNGIRVPN